MPTRQLVAMELGEILGVIADPDRIRIIEEFIEELGANAADFNSLFDS